MIYIFKAKLWLYPGAKAAWHFITVPKKESADIKNRYGKRARGWGSHPVEAVLGETRWKTSIFPDKKSGTYILPVKAAVRKNESIEAGETAAVSIRLMP